MLGTLLGIVSSATAIDWLILLGSIAVFLYVYGTWTYGAFEDRGIVFTRPKYPFAGSLFASFVSLEPQQTAFQTLYKKTEGHGVYGIFEFRKPAVMVRDPELLKIITVKEFDNFINHRSVQSSNVDPFFTKNLFNLKDQQWRDMRGTLSPAFTTSKIKGMFPLISQCAEQMAEYLRGVYAKSTEGNAKQPLPMDMKNLFSRMANDVIATTAFGVGCDSLKEPENKFYKMGKDITTFSWIRSLIIAGYLVAPKLMGFFGLRMLNPKAVDFFDSLVHETIRERQRKGIFRPDILQLLIQAREGKLKVDAEDAGEEEKISDKKKLDDDDVSAQAIIFFFAGFETVSTALCFTTHVLSHHPHEQKKLQEEIDEMMAATGGKPTYEAVQGMKYLDCVINETLRLYPPAPQTDRACVRDIVLPGGALVRKGDIIFIPIIGYHTDERYWDNPLAFRPERFNDENKHNIKPYTYMPFGLGPRICIGQRFALVEVKLALVHLLANFDLHPCSKTPHPVEFAPGFNVMVKGGFWCGLTPRQRTS